MTDESPQPWPRIATRELWEERYATSDGMWSGRVNQVLASIAIDLPPGRVLDVGCGEGADVIWLAQQGWDAVGIDVSETAVRRAAAAATEAGVSARFTTDALDSLPAEAFDLVTASYLHSPAEVDRLDLLRSAAELVAPRGHLLITSHAGVPPWAPAEAHASHHGFPSPHDELTALALPEDEWETVRAETRGRETTAPDGSAARIDDGILLLRRR